MELIRLNKYIAASGVCSRRKADEAIAEGRVSINGTIQLTPGVQIDPAHDKVCFDGKPISLEEEKVYIALNKPRGCVSTCSDDRGRRTVLDLLPEYASFRLFPVGRLDYDSDGLLIMTNDGDFAYCVTHPKHKLSKVYHALVKGIPADRVLEKLRKGVELEDGMTHPAVVQKLGEEKGNALISIEIHEGRNRQVRRMFDAVGHNVLRLTRVEIGGIKLAGIAPGKHRPLKSAELAGILQKTGYGKTQPNGGNGGRHGKA